MARSGQRQTSLPVALGLILLVAATFGRTLGHGFLNLDDDRYVYENPRLEEGLSAAGLRWAATTTDQAVWIPVTWVSLLADHQLHGLDPRGYHLTNLVFHAGNALLLFFLLRAWTGAFWRAALAAALFAVHPLNVEPVAWVTGRKDVLFMFFGLASLLAWRWRLRRPGPGPYLTALLLAFLAMGAKPMAVVLPVLMHLLDAWPGGRYDAGFSLGRFGRLVLEKIPFWAAAAAVAIVARSTAVGGEFGAPLPVPLLERVGRAAVFAMSYLQRLFLPVDLAVSYPVRTHAWSWPLMAACLLGLAALSWAGWRWRRQAPWLAVGWFWLLLTLLPVLDLVQGGQQLQSDRYAYLPGIGIFLAFACGLAALCERWRLSRALAAGSVVALVLALTGAAHVQAGYWRDNETVYRHALDVAEDDHLAQLNLATHLDAVGRTEEALVHARRSVEIKRTSAGLYNLGNILLRLQRPDEAADAYRGALKLRPDLAEAHSNLGLIAGNAGDLEEAERRFRRALALDPDLLAARFNLAQLLGATGRGAEARREIEAILARDPGHQGALQLRATLDGAR
jgi:tetratricopeptide (TPR) repeat protein